MRAKEMQAKDIFSLQGRVAMVTGAATGLGARFAQVLAANGAKLVLVGRKQALLEEVAAQIHAQGGQSLICLADVNNAQEMEAAFQQAESHFGLVDILVNNAGIAPPMKVLEMDSAHWQSVLGTNLESVFFTAQTCAKRLVAAKKSGNIINIASVLGFSVQKSVAAYAISKAAVMQTTRAMGLELAHKGIFVNAIAPGYIVTNINRAYLEGPQGASMLRHIPAGRFGAEEDLDGALLLLASPAARFMSGTTLVVDGGHLGVLGG
jgi:3-oxoacyl-[acyl-carrier protein] reductase